VLMMTRRAGTLFTNISGIQCSEGHPFLVCQGSDCQIHLEVLPWPLQLLLANDFYSSSSFKIQ
jgi:hypothetical protein